ncbi:DUF1573 domain-containing protein [Mesonia maritima]|uniref:DUF1573 domain-containing protein n=1 Tax=Mesonia maritima TaxID=1793873 RepID=A0ABU1K9E8_9FLAO|nr:DUF1573 domain-containing protein [Mesonia maritima]MDR6302229.1 hypothetical protein [Mesonia maritima]
MKNLMMVTILFFVGIATYAQAKIKFDSDVVDYGNIEYGSDGVRTFTFTNTGDKPLIIKDVKSTCGCTVPKKPEGEIAPGKTGEIQVKYDTKRPGPIRKTVTVYSNADTPTVPLKIKGYINKKDDKSVLEQ